MYVAAAGAAGTLGAKVVNGLAVGAAAGLADGAVVAVGVGTLRHVRYLSLFR